MVLATRTLIEQRAAELGFDACHVTSAAPPDSAEHFDSWLAGGMHGEMGYLQRNRHKRVDPREVLPDARSVIVLAASYGERSSNEVFNDANQSSNPEATSALASEPTPTFAGVVARYARFNDYHEVLGRHLKTLSDFVTSLGGPEARSLWYVDTGPVLERDLAERAGVGFIGKHTNLISRKLGNWFFLAEIITTLELPPHSPEKNRCGTCTRCLQACPTQAIIAPFQLDARRCISYLTIELKGAIPVELRPAVGNRIYGCDDCLATCP